MFTDEDLDLAPNVYSRLGLDSEPQAFANAVYTPSLPRSLPVAVTAPRGRTVHHGDHPFIEPNLYLPSLHQVFRRRFRLRTTHRHLHRRHGRSSTHPGLNHGSLSSVVSTGAWKTWTSENLPPICSRVLRLAGRFPVSTLPPPCHPRAQPHSQRTVATVVPTTTIATSPTLIGCTKRPPGRPNLHST